jgi:hypothetical protein
MKTTRRILANPDEAVKVDYASEKFREGLKRIDELNERDRGFKIPDRERKYESFYVK